jgi:hypothetical protein
VADVSSKETRYLYKDGELDEAARQEERCLQRISSLGCRSAQTAN